MKSVMLSIQPKWCELIASGEKTVEVRKTRPQLQTPFKCYIYCTNGKMLYDLKDETYLNIDHRYALGENKSNKVERSFPPFVNRKVIGEFVCDEVVEFLVFENKSVQNWNYYDLANSCLTYEEIGNYIGANKKGYAWHISDLKIYDKPKELGEFRKPCDSAPEALCYPDNCYFCAWNTVCRPPQSWFYCEELR